MTSPEVPPKERLSIGASFAVIVAAMLVLLSLMVIVPPFTMLMLPLAIGAAELSPFLVLFDLLWCLPANRLLRNHARLRWTSIVLLVVSACIAVRPLTQFNKVAAAASAQVGNDAGPPRFSLLTALRGLPTSDDVVERTTYYAAPDGTRLTLRLYTKSERATRPVVVVIYGGAWRRGDPSLSEDVSKALAARGFAVAAIDYRHAPGARFPAQIDDVNLSIGMLRDSSIAWGLDAERMAILGRSSGGHLAELAAYAPTRYPFKAVVALYAPYDLVQGYNDLPRPDPIGVRSVLRGFIGGTPDDHQRAYRAASPSTFVMPGLPPTLLIFGGRDHIVKPEFNRRAAAALRAARVPVVSVEVPWAEHSFDVAPGGLGSQLAFGIIADFLERTMKQEDRKIGR
jgi:acetyl esterase/lipase